MSSAPLERSWIRQARVLSYFVAYLPVLGLHLVINRFDYALATAAWYAALLVVTAPGARLVARVVTRLRARRLWLARLGLHALAVAGWVAIFRVNLTAWRSDSPVLGVLLLGVHVLETTTVSLALAPPRHATRGNPRRDRPSTHRPRWRWLPGTTIAAAIVGGAFALTLHPSYWYLAMVGWNLLPVIAETRHVLGTGNALVGDARARARASVRAPTHDRGRPRAFMRASTSPPPTHESSRDSPPPPPSPPTSPPGKGKAAFFASTCALVARLSALLPLAILGGFYLGPLFWFPAAWAPCYGLFALAALGGVQLGTTWRARLRSKASPGRTRRSPLGLSPAPWLVPYLLALGLAFVVHATHGPVLTAPVLVGVAMLVGLGYGVTWATGGDFGSTSPSPAREDPAPLTRGGWSPAVTSHLAFVTWVVGALGGYWLLGYLEQDLPGVTWLFLGVGMGVAVAMTLGARVLVRGSRARPDPPRT